MKNGLRNKSRKLRLLEVVDSAFIRAALGDEEVHKTTAGMIRTQVLAAAKRINGETDMTLGEFLDSPEAVENKICRPGRMGKRIYAAWEALLRKLDIDPPRTPGSTGHLSDEAKSVLKMLK
jgi:hypothetical protein